MSDLQSLFKKVLEEHQLDRYLFVCRCDERLNDYDGTYEEHLAAKLAEAVHNQVEIVTAEIPKVDNFYDPNWSL
jgi:hypothetical protein